MQRRNFIKTGSLAGLTISGLLSSKSNAIAETASAGTNVKDAFDLKEITITELQKMMQEKKLTSVALTQMYLKRIADIDKSGPVLNAVIELNKAALKIAAEMDKERAAGKLRGPMHGIPVLIKDNITTGDGMITSAGALAISDNKAAADAFIVKKLRESGAVLLGKTNLSEWANFRSSHSTSGWSSRGGQTRNPNVLDRNPSGSSAGTGSAVSANLCVIGIGTETNGSIVSPSSINGLVGIKPTVGLLSRTGIIPISATQDTAGPMARTVRDAAIFLGALAGADTADSATQAGNARFEKDYTRFLDAGGLKGKRLGVEKAAMQGTASSVKLLTDAIAVLKGKGAEVIEIELVKETRQIGAASLTMLLYEFKDGVNKYLATANSKVKTLEQVIAYNKANEDTAMPFFKQELLEQAQAKGDLNSQEYIDALKKTTSARASIDTLLKQNNLDAIIGPTSGFAVCIDLINGDYGNGFSFSGPAAMAGYPHITVPMGQWHGLPMGLSFFSTAFKEGELLTLAYAYEQASKKRMAPAFKSVIL